MYKRQVCIRDEEVVNASGNGYINFYVGEGDKVASAGNIYLLSSNPPQNSGTQDSENTAFSASAYSDIRDQITVFSKNYTDSQFSQVYSLGYNCLLYTSNGCSEEEREYIELIENIITNNGILDTSKLSSDDETSQLWATGNTSLYEYLHYAIGKDAIQVSALEISDTFLDSNQIYAALTEFILLELDGNNSFSKIVYCAMLNQGMISGQQICELLYEQGAVSYTHLLERGCVCG